MGSKCTSSYMISCNNSSKMSTNVASDEVKSLVKLAVIFLYLLRLNYEFFLALNNENNVVHLRDQLFMDKLKTVVP